MSNNNNNNFVRLILNTKNNKNNLCTTAKLTIHALNIFFFLIGKTNFKQNLIYALPQICMNNIYYH